MKKVEGDKNTPQPEQDVQSTGNPAMGSQPVSEDNPVIPQEALPYDPNMYGYKQNQKIEIEGNMLLRMISMANAIAMSETTTQMALEGSYEASKRTAKDVTTPLGLEAFRTVEILTQEHMNQIDAGVAVHGDILSGKQKETPSMFKVEDVSKKE